ncbi:MAG: hypothetical protein AAF797_12335 [Planctomycetota bacterium]
MATSYGALCTDFYINQKLAVKMDLPYDRETVLHFFDRVRKPLPTMNRFRRYDGEFALESSRRESTYHWLAIRQNSIRSGHVNPPTMESAASFHKLLLEQSPYHLTISPLDVDYLEVMFGFDLECKRDHDEIVAEALLAETPMGAALEVEGAKPLDMQPVLGLQLTESGDTQAYFEIKTRTKSRRGSGRRYADEPISLFLTLRRYGPIDQLEDLPKLYDDMVERAEALASDRLVPHLLMPISRLISTGSRE